MTSKAFHSFILICSILCVEIGNAKSKRRQPVTNRIDRQFEQILRDYRTGKKGAVATWVATTSFNARFGSLSRENRMRLRQLQASLAYKANYPILSAIYASESILLSPEPFHKANTNMWKHLYEISRIRPIQYILEELAMSLKDDKAIPPAFGNDWYYIIANSYEELQKTEIASKYYEKLTMKDRYFIPAQFHLGLIRFIKGDAKEAETRLRTILDDSTRDVTPIKEQDVFDISNYTYITLGRIHYEQKNFLKAAQFYRMVAKQSSLYYDALFEQAWALFMGGSPKHALGVLYGVNSPYFKDRFNPEAKVLESMIYFWMCRYDEARNALADFAENHSDAVESLSKFLDRQRLSAETAYQLFENLIAGVSSESLGIPENVLKTAAEKDSMLLVRDQYATLVTEIDRLQTQGFFGIQKNLEDQERRLAKINQQLRTMIGEKFLVELRSLKDHYDELYSQSQFLYLELLMGEKEHLLGRELHANQKVRVAASKEALRGWSLKSQSWEDDKSEYWWDEIGFQIIDVDPMCH